MPNPENPGDRAKASRLRKKKYIEPEDRLWLASYDENADKRRKERRARSFGASRSARRIKLDVEEQAESVGTGTAAAAAAAAALEAKEEGRRLDALTINAVDALKEACAVYKDICLTLKERAEVLEATHIAMLESVRAHYLSRVETEAEITALQAQQAGDTAEQLLMQVLGKLAGKKRAANGSPTGKGKPVDKTTG